MFAAGVEIGFLPALRNPDRKSEPKKKRPASAIPLGENIVRLEGRELAKVPLNVYRARPNLKTLYLRRNFITELPPEISRLSKLTKLDLSNNRLNELPPEIGALGNLRELLVDGNNLHGLPGEAAWCVKLELLDLSRNPLTARTAGRSLRDVWESVDAGEGADPARPPREVVAARTKAVMSHVREGLGAAERGRVEARLAALQRRGIAKELDAAARSGDEMRLEAALSEAREGALHGDSVGRAQAALSTVRDLQRSTASGDLKALHVALAQWWSMGGGDEGVAVREAVAAEKALRHQQMLEDMARRAGRAARARGEVGGLDDAAALGATGGMIHPGAWGAPPRPAPADGEGEGAAATAAAGFGGEGGVRDEVAMKAAALRLKHAKTFDDWAQEKAARQRETREGLQHFMHGQARVRRMHERVEAERATRQREREAAWTHIPTVTNENRFVKPGRRRAASARRAPAHDEHGIGGGDGLAEDGGDRAVERTPVKGGGSGGGDGDGAEGSAAVDPGSAFARRQRYWLQHRGTVRRARSARAAMHAAGGAEEHGSPGGTRTVGRGGGRGPILLLADHAAAGEGAGEEGCDDHAYDEDGWASDEDGEPIKPPTWKPF